MYFGILLFGLLIIAKLFYIHLKEGEHLKSLANNQEIEVFSLKASRGNILADDGSLLATSVPVFEIRMDVASSNISDKFFYENVDALAAGLSKILGNKSAKAYKDYLIKSRKQGKRYVLIRKKVTYEQLKEIRKLPILSRGKNSGGLIAKQTPRRAHPFNTLAERTIGYEIKKEKLFVGLEGAYTDVLTGKNGKQVMRRINHGDWIPIHDENEVEPQDGLDIITTIDINIQDIAENALLRQLMNNEAFQGCAVVMEVETGHIKAIANLRYDKADGKYKEIYNYAVGESIEPGSTFKLPNILVALEKGNIKLTDSVITREGFDVVGGMSVQDVHKIGNGRVTVRDVFEHSSNVGMAKVINRAFEDNPSLFIDGLYEMSLNKPLNIEISGEGQPYIKHPSNKKTWWGTSLTAISFGYEIQLTPLQILTFYNSIANDGVMVKPMFVTGIGMGDVIKEEFETEIINRRVVSKETLEQAQSLLEGVVKRGTGKNVFKDAAYTVAGKTGTAKIVTDGKYTRDYNASFVGYFPADDPKYSCIVAVNKPTAGKYYGGAVAAPAFREIADKIYSISLVLDLDHQTYYGDVQKPEQKDAVPYNNLKTIYEALGINTIDYLHDEDWAMATLNNEEIEIESVQFAENKVPNVKGMKAKDAVYLLENLGIETSLTGRGYVRMQSVKAGKAISKGQKINLQLAIY